MSEEKPKEELNKAECMGRYKHAYQWVWENGKMTDRMRCTTCGETKVKKQRFEGQ